MGNTAYQIGIHPTSTDCVAGEELTGRLYLECENADKMREGASSSVTIQMELWGRERTEIHEDKEEEEACNSGTRSSRVLTRKCTSSNIICHKEKTFTLRPADYLQLGQSQCEIPFEWHLPLNIPSSTKIVKVNRYSECDVAEISYVLTACILTQSTSLLSWGATRQLAKATTPLLIRRSVTPSVPTTAMVGATTGPQNFPIRTAYFWGQGSMTLEARSQQGAVRPGSTVSLSIVGDNQSSVPVKDFLVQFKETVTWYTTMPSLRVREHRTLATAKAIVAEKSNGWGTKEAPITMSFQVPSTGNVRETFKSGKLIEVKHTVEVIAQTAKGWTTNPKLYLTDIDVVVGDGCASPLETVSNVNDVATLLPPQGTTGMDLPVSTPGQTDVQDFDIDNIPLAKATLISDTI